MFTEEIRAVRDFFRQEGRVIRQAWATFIIGWLIFSAIVFGIFEWHFGGRLDIQRDTIENQKSQIEQLREELKGASPQLAAIQARRAATRDKLLELYVAAGPLINKHVPINYDDRKGMEEAVASLEREVNQWTEETASFIKTNLGPAAQDRFLDVSNMPIYTWNPNIGAYDQVMNALANRRKNLSLLIETSAYDR